MSTDEKPISDLDRLISEEGGKFTRSNSTFKSGKSKDDESAKAVNAFKQKAARSVQDVAQEEAAKKVSEELDEFREDPEPSTEIEQKRLERDQLEQVLLATQAASMRFENSIARQNLERRKRRVERLEHIEDKLKPLDLEGYFLRGSLTQEIPVHQYLTIVFYTPSFDVQALAAEVARKLIEDRGLKDIDLTKLPETVRNEEESNFHEKRTTIYGAAALATYLEMVNGQMPYGKPASMIAALPPDEQHNAIHNKATALLGVSASLLQEFFTHQGAFIARVRTQLEDVELLRQTQGNS